MHLIIGNFLNGSASRGSAAGDHLNVLAAAVHHVQAVREHLWRENVNCQRYFAVPLPYTKCHIPTSTDSIQLTRAIERTDLNCETLSWQWEALGDGTVDEFHYNACPVPLHRAAIEEGEFRKKRTVVFELVSDGGTAAAAAAAAQPKMYAPKTKVELQQWIREYGDGKRNHGEPQHWNVSAIHDL